MSDQPAGFYKGNQLWRIGLKSMLAKCEYSNPEELSDKCMGYFEWLEENQLHEAKLVSFEGVSRLEHVTKMRSPTLSGLCAFLGIHRDTWGQWRRGNAREDLREVVELVEQVMHEAKFTGAAAGLLNAMVIARDIGLADRSEITGKEGGPIQHQDLTDESTLRDEARRLGIPLGAFGLSDSAQEED